MDLLREQIKMLAGELALCTSSLKRLSEQATKNPEDQQLQVGYFFLTSLRLHIHTSMLQKVIIL